MTGDLRRTILSVSDRLAWLPPAIARLTLGCLFAMSGWKALHILDEVTEYFRSLGLPAPAFQAPFVATVELVCGLLLLLGWWTRLASLPLILTMVVAIVTAKKSGIHEPSDLFGLPEYLYVALLLWLGAYGAGRFSLDRLLERRVAAHPARS